MGSCESRYVFPDYFAPNGADPTLLFAPISFRSKEFLNSISFNSIANCELFKWFSDEIEILLIQSEKVLDSSEGMRREIVKNKFLIGRSLRLINP